MGPPRRSRATSRPIIGATSDPLDIPEERVFDYVVVADVIEREEPGAAPAQRARYLKPEAGS